MEEEEIAEKYLTQREFKKAKGFAINTQEMNPEGYDEIFFEGKELEVVIEDYVREVDYWIYLPSDGEQIFENIWEAVEFAEEDSNVSFDDFRKNTDIE